MMQTTSNFGNNTFFLGKILHQEEARQHACISRRRAVQKIYPGNGLSVQKYEMRTENVELGQNASNVMHARPVCFCFSEQERLKKLHCAPTATA